MSKLETLGKRAKISQSQQYVILAVLTTAILLGVAISLVLHFVNKISFNAKVIAEEEQSIVSYSNAIKNIGICRSPKGTIYTDEELKNCNPDAVEVSSIPGTLRANILENMASNMALNSVPKESTTECLNKNTNKNYTYKEMMEEYNSAKTSSELVEASNRIQNCSALRVIPDALPAYQNEEALLSSLNKIFLLSGWEPDSLSPSGSATQSSIGKNVYELSVRLSVESNTATTVTVLDNIERSIREFNITRATIEWGSNDTLILNAQATAYFTKPTEIKEATKKIEPTGGAKK